MHDYSLLEILAAGFTLALAFGYIAHKCRLSPIVGYLVAGIIIGPHTPGFVADAELAGQLAEAGVILLMFGVGLHFNMDDLFAVKGVALPGAVAQITAATAFGVLVGAAFGMPLGAGAIMGLGLAVASTVVLLRVLTDAGVVDTVHGHVAVGWLVVEDIVTVLALVLLPSLAVIMAPGASGSVTAWDMARALGMALVRLVALWVAVLVVGGRVVPWLLSRIARTRSQELFILTVLVAAFATAMGAAVFFQASMALGAFLGGMVIGKTKLSHAAGAEILPLRDAFAVLFFLSVGMLFDPVFLIREPLLVFSCMVIVIVVKPLTAALIITVLGYSARTAFTVAVGLAQVGEFSFILAAAAFDLKIIPQEVYTVLVVCALVSISLNPGLFRAVPRMEEWVRRRCPKLWAVMNRRANDKAMKPAVPNGEVPDSGAKFAIVVGYGPTGRMVAKALRENGLDPVVIDTNVDTVNALAKKNRWVIYGDAAKREVLHAAGIERAAYCVITVPDSDTTVSAAAMARACNPDVRILVRARFLAEEPLLRKAGASGIAFEEAEIADGLTKLVLEDVERCADGNCPVELDGGGVKV
ncbi:Inner membrane protein YbaL [uncultured delta proteobacterium]|uniref:Inner membrane protein YbaL n=1 Tax=uncultured delta proteobacterium TaxID=34034 RepID=A0A212JIT9_9DELT|nr:Inner membrane protein YbaL [uncultured delta proteobacterium]